ncbi:oplophorus-luciferin 2-monooxygenase non-catalytic subunit-like isoform X2 [Portunus trituberculatus]|uniref:oplophorus-luciferin 2-monooxygenase non-catalytic subunit-like isoform X2 n=1 Tax=Portunus trituberculatus TaxID=210409 RepID=UPI001E1CBE82|nr:oplophorus-luciferin 2-monooxygenase non-catalytic subunit-like isoform X2 [Portunus trituberculatus]
MALCYVPAVLAIAAVGLASRVPHPAELTGITPGWPCPIQTQIAPCICSMDTGYNLLMDCSLARSEEQLEKIFSSIFPFKDFYELKIEHNPDDTDNVIDKITANTFADISFERIIITGTRLQDIIDEAFADSHKTLRHLDLSFNTLHTFPFESLALYEQLHTFIIDNNQFPDLFDLESLSLEIFSASRNHNMKMNSPHPFRGAPSLRELYLSEIGLTTLRTRLFNNLTKLEVVDFSNNHLTRLEQETINVTVNTLRHVSFDDNDIFNISNGALIGFKEDATLSMVANDIVKLHEKDWRHIFQQITWRETIDLKDSCLCYGQATRCCVAVK